MKGTVSLLRKPVVKMGMHHFLVSVYILFPGTQIQTKFCLAKSLILELKPTMCQVRP